MENSLLNKNLVEQTLRFHGVPLIKTWNDENNPNNSLIALGIQPNTIDCSLYHERLKNFNYTDCAKRLRLHQFICSKAATIFRNYPNNSSERKIQKLLVGGGEQIPPLDYFSNFNNDERTTKFFMNLKPGDIAYGIVLQLAKNGLLIKVLCTTGSSSCLVKDLTIKGLVMPQNLMPALDPKNNDRPYMPNDYICCEVLQISNQYPPLILGMTRIHERFDNGPAFGLISTHDLPQFYKIKQDYIQGRDVYKKKLSSNFNLTRIAIDQHNQGKSYNQILRDSEAFNNPSAIDNLYSELGLEKNSYYTFMSKSKYPQEEYAKDLRQQQASKLAFRSVAEGIGHFKEGRHEEAFQCLNKALSIDPRNVEGLVARGALNANSGRFQKAIVDFDAALKLNPNHGNAKKYLGETLLAHGRSLEEESKFEEAQKAYIECLNVNPHHQEALASLNYIKTKINARRIVEPAELELPPLNLGGSLKDPKLGSKDETRTKKSKKDKKKRGKKRRGSSSDSSTESSDSSDSSSESSDNSSSSSDSDSRSKKKNKKRKSVSPPGRADIMEHMRYGQYGQSSSGNFDLMDEHEIKVKKFLEMSRDEDDYEEKVGQLIAEASKYQKSKQAEESKGSKKKKKSEKKLKKEKKKRKKDEKKRGKEPDIDDIREALKMFENLPEKIKKLYQDKIKEEELKQKGNESTDNNMSEEGKWKMKFSKTETDAKTKKAKNFSLYDSDDEDQTRNFQSHAPPSQVASTNPYATTSKAPSPKLVEIAPAPIVNQGPVVLDKFGNFRRVVEPTTAPVQNPPDTRRSRSKGRRSRSDSRSPRRHRSRSRRRFSHSRSRSHSRSPGRGGSHRSRPRYSPPSRGRAVYRGRFDKFRDNRDFRNDYRGERRGGRGRFAAGGRYDRRSFSRSPDNSRRMSRSPERKVY